MPSPISSQPNEGTLQNSIKHEKNDSFNKEQKKSDKEDNSQEEPFVNENTLKAIDFEDFKRSINEEFLNGTNDMLLQNNNSLKSNQPIDPSRINDSLKLYGESVMSRSYNCNEKNSRNYVLQKSGSASSKFIPPFYDEINFYEKSINRSKSGPNCFLNTESDEETATLKPSTIKRNDVLTQFHKIDCHDEPLSENKVANLNTNSGASVQESDIESYTSNQNVEDEVILRRPPKTGASAIKRRSGNKRYENEK